MDVLHLSYTEVVDDIPYRNLILMQEDKLHEIYGDRIEHHSARENPKFEKMIK